MALNSVNVSKERIIDAAFSELSRDGDVSMRSVADSIGVTATALYYHFASKQKLLDAVADRGFGMFDSRLRAVWHKEPKGVVLGILDGYRQFAADHPNLFRLMFVEARPTARKFPADFAAHRLAVFNSLWKAVGEYVGEPGDGDHEESLYIAHDLWALTHGQILLWRAGRFTDERAFREVLRASIDRFLSSL
jgi:AcrR family transcriptional regulator